MTQSPPENRASCIEGEDFFALPAYSVVDLNGPDAVAFAHSQFANDVTALAIGQWQWNCWLTAKGRVIAVFALLHLGQDRVRLLLPDLPAAEMAAALGRFVFRRKVSLQARTDLGVSGRFAAPAAARGQQLALTGTDPESQGVELDLGGPGQPRCLVVAPWSAPEVAQLEQAWARADLQLGLPRLGADQREHWTPQQLGLERLSAYSVKKGCYPGQEIVARTHFLGKAKREALLLQVPGTATPGMEVHAAGEVVGRLASVAGHGPTLGLAVVNLERDPAAALTLAGQACPSLPFWNQAPA
jgi:folate-binding protein YgfZ